MPKNSKNGGYNWIGKRSAKKTVWLSVNTVRLSELYANTINNLLLVITIFLVVHVLLSPVASAEFYS